MELPQHLASGPLVLLPAWQPLAHVKDLPFLGQGLYAIGFPSGVRYDGGASCIAYIGSTIRMRTRLMQHRTHPHNWELGELRRYGDLSVAYWPLAGIDSDWLFAIEGEALCYFERQFGTMPICNRSVPATPYANKVRGLVEVVGCETPRPISLDELAAAIEGFRVRRRYRPGDLKKSITANEWFYEGVEWPSDDQVAALVRERDLNELRFINLDVVAAWSVGKYTALLAICASLTAEQSKGNVLRFQSSSRRTPRPHTWGEVALLKARLVSGCWLPEKRVWLKVCCGKELLGQAIVDSFNARGEDKSSLPQCTKPRRRSMPDVEALDKALNEAAAVA